MTKEANERRSLDDATPAQWDAASQAAREDAALEGEEAPIALRFPTMLRKMWSGIEVQNWLDEQGPLYARPAPAYPAEMTPALQEVLSLMLWNTGPIAHVLRTGGAEIRPKAEDEQAHVLHWLIQLALRHDEAWRSRAVAKLNEIKAGTAIPQ
ncbi:hypothetical protein ACU4GI_10880 [Cupriavidus basilensis]